LFLLDENFGCRQRWLLFMHSSRKDALQQAGELVKAIGLGYKIVRTHIFGLLDGCRIGRCRKNNDGDLLQVLVLLYFLQYLVAAHNWHVQVHKNNIGLHLLVFQLFQSLMPAAGDGARYGRPNGFQSYQKNFLVVDVIIYQQNITVTHLLKIIKIFTFFDAFALITLTASTHHKKFKQIKRLIGSFVQTMAKKNRALFYKQLLFFSTHF
jgi:hypothetical protein